MTRLIARSAFLATVVAGLLGFGGALRAATYEVGPGKTYSQICDVSWETLQPGDTVLIHWRPEPYREKWGIGCSGTAAAPITVRGVTNASGERPIIDGDGARTRRQLRFTNEDRGVIKIGGGTTASSAVARHIVLENLDVRGGRPPYTFVGVDGLPRAYRKLAAAIYIERGEHIVVRNCLIHDSGNGLFVSSGERGTSREILIERNHLYDNGNVGSAGEHNSYTEAQGIVFQYNHFGPQRAGCPGINLKDRSAGTVVRYNWIEGGNLQLSLVEAEDSRLVRADPRYAETFVYGNVLLEPAGDGLGLIARYGGDSRKTEWFRKGTLYFYHNTIVSRRSDRTTVLKLSTDAERCEFRNNIVQTTAPGKNLRLAEAHGIFELRQNWFKSGWKPNGKITGAETTLTGETPGFVDEARDDFRLQATAPGVGRGGEIAAAIRAAQEPVMEYVKHRGSRERPATGRLDLGAFAAATAATE